MKRTSLYIFSIATVCFCSTNQKLSPETSFEKDLEKVADSVKVNDIVVKNLFKYQILAHRNGSFDPELINEKVYQPHKNFWTAAMP